MGKRRKVRPAETHMGVIPVDLGPDEVQLPLGLVGLGLQGWLQQLRVGEGALAQTNTMTLWWDGRYWRLSLHDRLRCVVSYLAHEDLDVLLQEAEYGLSADTLSWRPSHR